MIEKIRLHTFLNIPVISDFLILSVIIKSSDNTLYISHISMVGVRAKTKTKTSEQ